MASRLLIVKSAALGDVLRTTALLPVLARRHRGGVWWLTAPAAAPLLSGNPRLRGVLTLSGGRLEGKVPARGFDRVLSLEEDEGFAAAARDLCRGELVGIYRGSDGLSYTASSARYYDMSLLNRDPDGGLREANALKSANRLTYAGLWSAVLGLHGNHRPQLVLTDADRRPARAWLSRRGLKKAPIGLNAGAGARWPSKQVGFEQACALARSLGRLGRPVVLLGGQDERERNRKIAAATEALQAPLSPLRVFAGFVERCAAVVTTDSLTLHVATALGRPAVVLVGPTSFSELDVYGRGEKLRPAGGCACFYRPRCSRARHCMDEIPPGRVAAAVERWL